MTSSIKKTTLFVSSVLLIFQLNSPTQACTDVRLKAKDGAIVISRSMEYALDLKSNLRTSTRGRQYTTTAPDGKSGLSWKAKYGYVFLDALNTDITVDGMNEKGLAFEALYLPTLAQYQTIPPGSEQKALPYYNVGDWVLSNFDSVDQVKDAIKKVYVFEQKLPAAGDAVFPLHFSIHDASGKSLVIEYVGGSLNVYDNQLGVLTNTPDYKWHTTNLINYLHLTPTNPPPVIEDGVKFAATGQGFGMVGLPGDISPPSRFVKSAVLVNVALPASDAQGTINLGEHIMNNFDIPLGLAREPNSGNATNELTQWVVIKDLTNKVFYYRTYNNLSLRSVALAQLDFSDNAARLQMPISSAPHVQDVTKEFLASKKS